MAGKNKADMSRLKTAPVTHLSCFLSISAAKCALSPVSTKYLTQNETCNVLRLCIAEVVNVAKRSHKTHCECYKHNFYIPAAQTELQ